MKKILAFALLGMTVMGVQAQERPKPASPPATVTQKINSGATVTISYSQPSLKGRAIGKDVEPMMGKVWRMGANNATVFEVDQDVTINGQKLPAGKYSMFGLQGEKDFSIIFNKEWKIWGTQYNQHKEKDALRITANQVFNQPIQELLTYTINADGRVTLQWGTMMVDFTVQ